MSSNLLNSAYLAIMAHQTSELEMETDANDPETEKPETSTRTVRIFQFTSISVLVFV